MIIKSIPSSWLTRTGRRLDCGPYTSGALEARIRLESLRGGVVPLSSVTRGGLLGIYHAGREGRTWVDDPEYGVPFLSSSSILAADLSNLPLISRKQVQQNPLFTLRKGWTLITRSGTIGRMVYCRPDMDGLACSEHVMRVVPDPDKIPPGYLYAYLSSRFGVPQVVSGTYGSIIQSIEPQHIADLPVPRLGEALERQVHELVEEAGRLRARAATTRFNIIEDVEKRLGWSHRPLHALHSVSRSSALGRRMDAFHHSSPVQAAVECLRSHPSGKLIYSATREVFEPNRGPRLKVDDTKYGIPFVSSSEVFKLDPVGDYLVSRRRTAHLEQQILTSEDILLPRSGQLGGIIGRAILPLPTIIGHAGSEHLVRVRCRSRDDAFFIWAILATEPGYYAAIGTAFGSSIPSLDCRLLSELSIPWWDTTIRQAIVERVRTLIEDLANAISAERSGRMIVEKAIEEAS